ncbi:MAG: alpha/beta fold hydrolase [Mesorhizobium sp.]|uniref:alpha/beta hydrolase n=1 Tax=unclassified Mesorhizobium TaxID=325217 RepID=UPI000FC9F9B3|nr:MULTISPECIES: alpha/beta hydrolase [unclassified Mesorhizobium]RUV80509.1 alpha/beta fold hydrolase [Mesorhizobium sp. M5C.F.Ca.IN.020.14.1.1]RUV61188.1 alpha/beta fold hydrolase [Mesorhizobium sp. M5C.F.Ca.IN.020.29.1.1]RWC40857.1 MAG: alpha/beta fold hydrolase [Mesorhizobium sp.]RWD51714.1 MAG: alpha/beta fold hydrolase [Mesorhizobium sp.]RWE07883.1 MAG: alpha/beta fold hydrolase [Mesorhizobium sp.]
MASFGLKVIRGVFAAAEHVAPRLTGRAAFELFCRTPNAKVLSDGERRAVDRAAGFMAEARHHRLKAKNGCVMVHEFRPEPGRRAAGTVLVIHGWRSRTEYMRTLIEGYRDAGYKVVSLDLPGHGQSQGRRLTLVSAVEAARLTGEWFGPFVAVVGHSFGGAVAANAVVGSVKNIPPLAAERLVLIAAPSSLPAIFDDFSRMLNVGRRSQAAMADRVERIAGRPLHEFVGDRQLASTPVPTLVIHAPDDREVSADHARLYAGAGDHVRLYWADGLGHRRILADRGVVERAIGFVAEHREPSLLH